MSINTTTAYDQWQHGNMSGREALRALLADYGEIKSEITPHERELAAVRELIEEIAMSLGEPFQHAGLEVAYVPPTQTASYDKKAVDQVVHALITSGHHEIAAQLASAKKEGTRSGYVRIGPPPTEKQRKK